MDNFLKFIKKYALFAGVILLAILISTANLDTLWQNIRNLKIPYFAGALIAVFPMLAVKAWCWNYIKKAQGIKYSLKDSFLMYCSGLFIGVITPGRIGELSKAFYLNKDGHPMGKSLVSPIIDRLTDFIFLLAFSLAGSLFFLSVFTKQILILFGGTVIFTGTFLLLHKTGLLRWIFKKIFDFLAPEEKKKSWHLNYGDFVADLKNFSLKNWIIIFLITIFSWLFYYLMTYLLSKSLSLNVPFLYLSIAVTITGLITLLPVSVSGIGTRDAALIILLAPFSVAKENALVFSALILFMSLLTCLVGFFCWLKKSIIL